MKIIIVKKYELDFNENDIKECKEHYKKYPEYSYNLGNKKEFLTCLKYEESYDELNCIYTDIEEKSYNEFLKKWNKM